MLDTYISTSILTKLKYKHANFQLMNIKQHTFIKQHRSEHVKYIAKGM